MPHVTVTINGHGYAVACDPGEERRIADLARVVELKVQGFAQQTPRAGEARLLTMAALTLADELAEAHEELHRLSQRAAASVDDPVLVEGVDRLARRIEAVAARLDVSHI